MIRKPNPLPYDVWTIPSHSVVDDSTTIVLFSCDYMIESTARFINTGMSLQNSGSTKVARLVGDATHDETSQHLKRLRIA